MNWIQIPVLAMIPLSLYAALFFMWIYARMRDDRRALFFALACLAIGLYEIGSAGMYSALTTAAGIPWQRCRLAAATLFCIAIAWFVREIAGAEDRRPYIALAAVNGLFVPLIFAGGDLVLNPARPLVLELRLPFLGDITVHHALPGSLTLVLFATLFISSVFILTVMVRRVVGGRRDLAPFLAAMVLLFAAALNDAMVNLTLYSFPYLGELAFTLLILAMAQALQDEFIRLHREVRELNDQLESRVTEGMLDLFLSQVGSAAYARMLGGSDGASPATIQSILDAHKAETITALSREISLMTDVDRLLHRVAAHLMETASAQHCALFFAGPDGALEAAPRAEVHDESLAGVHPRDEAVERAFADGRAALDETAGADQRYIAALPLRAGGRVIGVCRLENRLSRHVFTAESLKLMEEFLSQLAEPMAAALAREGSRDAAQHRRHGVTDVTARKIERAAAYLRENFREDVSREGLAASLNMHPDSLGRFFKVCTGKKMSDFVNELRILHAAAQLTGSDQAVTDIAFDAGFESLTTFNRIFRQETGESPSEYRAKRGT